MTTPDYRKMLVIGFDDPLKANEFLLAVLRLRKNEMLQLHDAVFVRRDAEGRSSVQETQDISTGRGALGGGVWGLLIGTLLGGPIGGLIGGAATAGSGALLAKLIDTGIKDEQIGALRQTVPPGSTALALRAGPIPGRHPGRVRPAGRRDHRRSARPGRGEPAVRRPTTRPTGRGLAGTPPNRGGPPSAARGSGRSRRRST